MTRLGTVLSVILAFAPLSLAADEAAEVLARTKSVYAAMTSYADTGVIVTEYQMGNAPGFKERHTFRTFYQSPRRFFFDFNKDPNAGKERLVIWSDGGDFNSWWSATGVHDTYPKGQGANAFALSSMPTKGSAVLIAPLLFSKAGLQGAIASFVRPTLAAKGETVGGHRCYRLNGVIEEAYGATGNVTGSRRATLWIDADSSLVVKLVEEAPTGSPAGMVDRITTTFDPKANPALADSVFRFTPPAS